jgi:hypothetical protein
MARVLPGIPEAERSKFMSSPRLAMQRVEKEIVALSLPGRQE